MSYLEFIGTVLYLASVWLIARRHVWTWPLGIISVVLYMALFYQIRLYADALEQVYFLGASCYGWWYWNRIPEAEAEPPTVFYSSPSQIIAALMLIAALTLMLTSVLTRVHLWLPSWFPEAASAPFWDALTTIMSFVAMWLMVQRRVESWLLWIVVDVIGIWLYWVKDVRFLSLLYVVLLALAINGFWSWHQSREQKNLVPTVA
jgi:nicotinamide mononucleotide transporter